MPIKSVIAQVSAHDPDQDLNGQVTYSFTKRTLHNYGHLFGINNITGEIYLRSIINYEKGSVYHLAVVAKDNGPESLPADATVLVKVEDVNDHNPAITINTLAAAGTDSVEIAEDAEIGTFVAHVTVNDPDGGLNGKFGCLLNGNHFRLQQIYESEYKISTASMLDRETTPSYRLSILCKDLGKAPKSTVKHLKVVLLDANDFAPRFTERDYIANIVENNFKGAYIVQVNATDR